MSRKTKATSRRRSCRLGLEPLEERCLLSAPDYRPISEIGNNIANPTWGATDTDLLRLSPSAYADGISKPSAPNTLSPREISNNLNNQSDPIYSFADNLGPPQSKSLSDFAYVWGQFIDHDMDLTPTQSGPNAEAFNIPADPTRPNDTMGVEAFLRSVFDPATGTSTRNPRQQVNADTSFLDLSQVYGSTDGVADALRTHSGGLLKTSPGGLLPYDSTTYFNPAQIAALNMVNDAQQVAESDLFAAGDVRANENIELTAMQTLFVRNHNRLAGALHQLHPDWTDEQLYQEARKLNIATEEMITYNEFLPAILGPDALPHYTGYKPHVNPAIATEFSTVAFRFGHSLLSDGVGRNNNDGTDITDVNLNGATVNLAEDFFRPDLISPNATTVPLVDRNGNLDPHTSSSIGAILKADADNAANEMDLMAIDEVRSLLFGIPYVPGTDLIARDIQRARDDGLGTYNQLRLAFGLPVVTRFAQISSDPSVQAAFRATYGTLANGKDNVNAIDPLEGMFAEDHVAGGDVGPTIKVILADQFARLRDGDRFFYLNESFNTEEQDLLASSNTLAKVIEDNTSITNLQSNVFYFKESIRGRVYDDRAGVAGVTVNLIDDSGAVVASTTTNNSGNYRFTDQTGIPGTGNFVVAIVVPAGYRNVTPTSIPIAISRGGLDFDQMNFVIEGTSSAGPALASPSGPVVTGSSSGVVVASVDAAQTATLATALAGSTGSGATTSPASAPAEPASGAGSFSSVSNQSTLVFLAKRGKASASVDPASGTAEDGQSLSSP